MHAIWVLSSTSGTIKIEWLSVLATCFALACAPENVGPEPGTGGSSSSTGGVQSGSGGSTSTGGITSTGGNPSTGGSSSASGGTVSTGGKATGGAATGGKATGGATTGGSSTGGRATGGATGTGGVAGCTAVPVTPNATQQTRNVLCYLYSQYGNHILSGQEEGGSDSEINYIFTNTGKYPAIRAFEANGGGAATRCLPYWNAGGLCMFGYHMGAPGQPDTYQGSMTRASSINTVLTPGTSENTVFNQRLDALADRLLTVQAGNGVVLFRPFHEAGGNWFWWSMEGGAQYVRLWKYAFDRFINTKGVRNAIWLLGYNGSPNASFYAGKEYVDIGGADTYASNFNYGPLTSMYDSARGIFGTTMPIALHECGPIPDPDQLQSTGTKWVLFNVWTNPYPTQANTVAQFQKVYGHSYVVTRDEMPNLR